MEKLLQIWASLGKCFRQICTFTNQIWQIRICQIRICPNLRGNTGCNTSLQVGQLHSINLFVIQQVKFVLSICKTKIDTSEKQ